MARRFAWLLNFEAELELENPHYYPSTRLRTLLDRYATAAHSLLRGRDILVSEHTSAKGFIGRAWCPTRSAVARLEHAGTELEAHPPLDVIRRVNHRRFASELGAGPPGARFVTDLAALLEQTSGGGPWLLKRPLAFAGRGQLRVFERVTDAEMRWIEVSLARDGLAVEPFVTPTLELAVHGYITRSGTTQLGEVCVQSVTERGTWQASRRLAAGELSATEVDALGARAAHVSESLHAAGYFGPFGIDAYRYRSGREHGFCSLSEINARFSMGFVVGFPRPVWELCPDRAVPSQLR